MQASPDLFIFDSIQVVVRAAVIAVLSRFVCFDLSHVNNSRCVLQESVA